jgi:2-isopropylmalate synthase
MSVSAEPNRVIIFDTTLRDGEQSPGASMNLEEKLRIAEVLQEMGVDVIEAGFPIASNGDFEAVREVAKLVRKPIICALARSARADLERAAEALKPAARGRIHTFIATSPLHMKYKLQMAPDKVLEHITDSISYARRFTDDVDWSPEDASRSEPDFLCKAVELAIKAGATCINLPDTVGYSVPDEYAAMFRMLIERVPGADKVVFSTHCHNDLGLAVANSLAAVENGARQVECTVNGIGERAGNASLEEIVMSLHTRKDFFGVETCVDTHEIFPSSSLLTNLTGLIVQVNKAIVGRNAFAHEAGIHQDGVLKEKSTYEIMRPETVGIKDSSLVMGKHSGRHALKLKFQELGFLLSPPELEKAYVLFKKVADRKKEVFDDDLVVIVRDGLRIIPDAYKIKYIQSSGGNQIIATATLVLEKEGNQLCDSAIGDGPVDAALKAIDRITGIPGKLLDYTVRSVTSGKDAVGEVFMRVDFGRVTFVGKAASTDVVDASARAYLNAINKMIHYQTALMEHQQRLESASQ